MRRALGLTGDRSGQSSPPQTARPQAGPSGRPAGRSSADKQRHRFVQDGAVPVTILNRHRPDDADAPSASRAAIEAALRDERATRARAERTLQDALASVHDLQTKLGHAELAHREASAAAQTMSAELDALRAERQEQALRWREDLAAERAARTAAEAALAASAGARRQAARTRCPPPAVEPAFNAQDSGPAPAASAAAKRTRKAVEPRRREPQPVKWWLTSARKRWP